MAHGRLGAAYFPEKAPYREGSLSPARARTVTPKPPPRADKSRRLTVLSPAEWQALYEVPDFDEFQRAQYFAFTAAERALAEQRKGFAAQLYCMVQIGYFKAKNAFFNLAANAVPAEDVAFLIERYFPGRPATFRPVAAHEQYAQRTAMAKLFGYRLWSATDQPSLAEAAAQLARRDVTPALCSDRAAGVLERSEDRAPGLRDTAEDHRSRPHR